MIAHTEPASVGQRMLWLVDRYRGGRGNLNYPLLLRLRGPLDPARLASIVDELVARHESLRTTFARRDGLLTQLVHEPGPVPITAVDVEPATEDQLRTLIRAEVIDPIDAAVNPLRVTSWSLGPDHQVLCLNAHHLVTDAWSCRVLVEELTALLAGAPLPRPGWSYRHVTRWQRRPSSLERMRTDREYWQGQLGHVRAPDLPYQPAQDGSAGVRTLPLDVGPADTERLRALARAGQTTLFTVLLSLFYRALHEQCGDTDLAVASPFANRVRPEVMRTVGFLANQLVLRTTVEPGEALPALLARTARTVGDALAHQAFPYFLPPAADGDEADRTVDRVVFQLLPELPDAVRAGDVEVSVLPPELASRFDLELSAVSYRAGLRILVQYAVHRTGNELAERLAAGYQDALEQACLPELRFGT